jgi:hypothetical protein
MKSTQNADLREASSLSDMMTDLFAEAMQTRQVAFTDWYQLMSAPLGTLECEYEANLILITRLIYAVKKGMLKVVDDL